ncbi:MAG: hypothetical protein J7K47_00075 [Thermoplasmata archaeon]|nr:hypothetical protein [Thermoplasmata archaeon]
MLDNIQKIDLRELSTLYDEESRDVFISLYLNVENLDKKFIEERANACKSVLKDGLIRENFEKTMDWINDYIKEGMEEGQKGLIIFASYLKNFFTDYKLGVPLKNMLVVDSSPYIKPVAELLDLYDEYGLVMINNNKARIYTVSGGKIGYERGIAEHVMNKHKKGGWSQARFQRIRKGEIKHFLKRVAEDVEKLDVKYIILAGPGEAKKWLVEYLPKNVGERVISFIDAKFGGDVVASSEKVIEEEKSVERKELIQNLVNEILRNGLAVHGVRETIEATRNAQVEMLLIKKGFSIKGWKCEKCQIFDVGSIEKCPYCDSKTTSVDVIEELIELAERTDASIEFIDDDILSKLGGIAGFLRYKASQ